MNSFEAILGVSAKKFPDSMALRDERISLTYAQLSERVARISSALRDEGVRPGDTVVLIACNSCACIEVMLACFRVGAVYSSCNTRFSAEITAELLCDAEPKVVCATALLFGQLSAQERFSSAGFPFTCVCLDEALGGEYLSYDDLISHPFEGEACHSCCDDDPALILYTSGTTMKPKDVVISHGALRQRIEIDIRSMGISREDVFLCALPLFHTTCVTSLVMLARGARIVILSQHDSEAIAEAIERHGVTFVGLIPALLKNFVSYLSEAPRAFPTLRTVLYGGSPMTAEFAQMAQTVLSCGFLQGYGMTETSSSVTLLSAQDHKDPRLLSTVGRVVEGMEIKIVNDELSTCAVGVPGEIAVKTPTVMSAYRHHPEKTAQVLRDGWYLTGDIGFVDERGYLTLLDRKDNMIITGGENVFPLQVANCIREMGSYIADVYVVGLPDERWGEIVAAAVVVEKGFSISADEVQAYCQARLGGFMKPRKVVVTSDGFKRNAMGKVERGYVMDLLTGEGEQEEGASHV